MSATWQELTHPEDLEADLALAAEVVAGRRDFYQLTKRYVRPDGSIVWGDLSVSCVRGDDGAVEYFVAQIVDVTDQAELRQQLSESEARFRLLAENSSTSWSSRTWRGSCSGSRTQWRRSSAGPHRR